MWVARNFFSISLLYVSSRLSIGLWLLVGLYVITLKKLLYPTVTSEDVYETLSH